jgi:two-component system response regulator AtoC
VIEIRVPPLRERKSEILPLVEFVLIKYSARYGRPVARPSQRLRDALLNYSWPGNVRELENVLKRHVILQDDGLVLAELERQNPLEPVTAPLTATAPPLVPPAPLPASQPPTAPVSNGGTAGDEGVPSFTPIQIQIDEGTKLPALARQAALSAEREAIAQALDKFRWNRRKAAKLLGVSYKTLLNKMKECGIRAAND